MTKHAFQLNANWTGGRLGEGTISIGHLKTPVSIPAGMGGPGVGTNPEELLVSAAANCYLITLAAILENRKLPIQQLALETDGVFSDAGGLHLESIIHHPKITLTPDATSEQIKTAHQAAERAEQACMVSKALRGNAVVRTEPEVIV